MKSIGFILVLSLKGTLFPASTNVFFQQNKNITINDKQLNKDEFPRERILQVYPTQALIIGRWRGYHETPEMTIYYGYEFRPNGIYVARHRVYQQEKTILDQYWQGKWNFDGKILSLEGTVTDGDSTIFQYSFRLDKDNLLYYQGGNLPAPYLPGKMGKFS